MSAGPRTTGTGNINNSEVNSGEPSPVIPRAARRGSASKSGFQHRVINKHEHGTTRGQLASHEEVTLCFLGSRVNRNELRRHLEAARPVLRKQQPAVLSMQVAKHRQPSPPPAQPPGDAVGAFCERGSCAERTQKQHNESVLFGGPGAHPPLQRPVQSWRACVCAGMTWSHA